MFFLSVVIISLTLAFVIGLTIPERQKKYWKPKKTTHRKKDDDFWDYAWS